MKTSMIIMLAIVAVLAVAALAPGFVKECGYKLHDALFSHMARSGLVLGMAEVKSTQMTNVAAGQKMLPGEDGGRYRTLFARYVQGAGTQAVSDTIYLGDLPKGARISRTGVVSLSTGTASCTLNIGLRTKSTGTVLSATAIASGIEATTAGQKACNNGAYIGSGEEYVTVAPVEVYATIVAAVLAAAQKLTFEIPYVQD